jgi:FtsH-binding integral membrane protein
MGIAVAQPRVSVKPAAALPGRRFDRLFFSLGVVAMAISVVVGFGPTYYWAGLFRAPLPSPIIHVHGAVFSCWILLLLTQTTLVSARRVDIHKKLGIAGFLLAVSMVVIGEWAATSRLVQGFAPPGLDPYFFYVIPVTDMVIFGTLIFFAFRYRSDSSAHKRLVYVATTALLIAAIARWPWHVIHRNAPRAAIVSYVFLIALIGYDLWSTRKVHRATLWASAFLVFVQQIRLPIGKTAAWHSFAVWIQSLAR